MSLVLFELKKLLRRRWLLIAAAVLIEGAMSFFPAGYEHPYSPQVYRRYCEQLAGEYTLQKRELILSRLEEINVILAEHEQLTERYNAGEITLEELSARNKAYNKAAAEAETAAFLAEKCRYLDALEGGQGRIFCDTDWSDLFTHRGFALTSVLVVLLLIPPVFCNEYSCGTANILRTARHGKARLAAVKLTVSAVMASLISLLLSGAELGAFAARCGLDGSGEPLQSIMGFDGYGGITVIGFFIRSSLLRSISCALFAAELCLISVRTESLLFTGFLGFAVCQLPALLSEGSAMCYIFPALVQKGMYPAGLSLWAFCLVCLIRCGICAALCIRKFSRPD